MFDNYLIKNLKCVSDLDDFIIIKVKGLGHDGVCL